MLGSSRGFSVIVAAQSAQPRTLPATSDRTNPTHVALPPAFHLGVLLPGICPRFPCGLVPPSPLYGAIQNPGAGV